MNIIIFHAHHNIHMAVQKSPPLRKGKHAMPRSKGEGPGDAGPPGSSDPGMVIAFDSKVGVSLLSASSV